MKGYYGKLKYKKYILKVKLNNITELIKTIDQFLETKYCSI